jgi:hypothetical protein
LLVSASLSAIAVFLLATATANTALFAQGYRHASRRHRRAGRAADALSSAGNSGSCRRNLKAGVFGSRLAVRLVFLFALVAGLPGALVYAVSAQFIGRSIESWFDVRVDRALDSGLDARRQFPQVPAQRHDEQGHAAGRRAVRHAGQSVDGIEPRRRTGERIRGDLFTPTGGVLAVAGTGASARARRPSRRLRKRCASHACSRRTRRSRTPERAAWRCAVVVR